MVRIVRSIVGRDVSSATLNNAGDREFLSCEAIASRKELLVFQVLVQQRPNRFIAAFERTYTGYIDQLNLIVGGIEGMVGAG